MPRQIILGCDPGHDDALALMLAHASSELDLIAVTTTFGNVGLERTTRNALKVLEFLGSSVPVYAGADRPLVRDRIDAAAYHGVTGMDGAGLPEPARQAEGEHAVLALIREVMRQPGEISIVVTGPLTNLALALRLEPRLAGAVREVIVMGGSTEQGNDSPAAEFNFLADPHAARIVLEAAWPLTLFGLRACLKRGLQWNFRKYSKVVK